MDKGLVKAHFFIPEIKTPLALSGAKGVL